LSFVRQQGEKAVVKNISLKSLKGFSLIELMISMSLFSFSLLGVVSMQVQAQQLINQNLLKQRALQLAIARQELFELSSSQNNISGLLSAWQNKLEETLPDPRVISSVNESILFINISWLDSSGSPNSGNCSFEKEDTQTEQTSRACLQL
jgi:prepilin-type N-terminal cleavage/methylation domain-containing protein